MSMHRLSTSTFTVVFYFLLFGMAPNCSATAIVANMKPTSDVAQSQIIGSPNTSALYNNLADGTSFGSSDGDTSYIRSNGGVVSASYTAGYSGAAAGQVTQVSINYVARRVATSGTIQAKLYDGSTLIGTGAVNELGTSYANYTDTFTGLSVANANSLRTEVDFTNTSSPLANAIRLSEIWITATISPPFRMFAATASALQTTLEDNLTSSDYIAVGIARNDAILGGRISHAHLIALPTSVQDPYEYSPGLNADTVSHEVTNGCNTTSGMAEPGLILYDVEHWAQTPSAENASYSAAGAAIGAGYNVVITGEGTGCTLQYGTVPDGQFMGLPAGATNCTPNLTNSVLSHTDWTQIAFLDIQAQRALSDSCGGSSNLSTYVDWVTSVASYVRNANPRIIVAAQLSFADSDPTTMTSAINGLTGVVDGFYIAYPSGCEYCSTTNLNTVLSLSAFQP